jgi:hypothetical protein
MVEFRVPLCCLKHHFQFLLFDQEISFIAVGKEDVAFMIEEGKLQ